MNNKYDKETLLLCIAELQHSGILSGECVTDLIYKVLISDYPNTGGKLK